MVKWKNDSTKVVAVRVGSTVKDIRPGETVDLPSHLIGRIKVEVAKK